jgi:hypothetical protein
MYATSRYLLPAMLNTDGSAGKAEGFGGTAEAEVVAFPGSEGNWCRSEGNATVFPDLARGYSAGWCAAG